MLNIIIAIMVTLFVIRVVFNTILIIALYLTKAKVKRYITLQGDPV